MLRCIEVLLLSKEETELSNKGIGIIITQGNFNSETGKHLHKSKTPQFVYTGGLLKERSGVIMTKVS